MSTDEIAIAVHGVHKTFKLPHEQHSGIKQAIVNFSKRKKGFENQHVLKGLSFEIKKGEFFGIVGRNGSGKSTLLKLLAGIYTPDKGHIQINGSLTPFIELGVGFNPELTGRENVYMNGALLGFSNKQMDAMYDEIVEFAELERFMDQRLKNYSSGMQVRLAFSIAIKAKSDILLIDEVLAVGDSAFQKKCFEYFVRLKKDKKTVVLVTHDMGAVERFCDRALVINQGESLGIHLPHDAATVYDRLNVEKQPVNEESVQNKDRWGSGEIQIGKVTVNGQLKKNIFVQQGDDIEIAFHIESQKASKNVVIGLAIFDQFGVNMSGPNSEGLDITAPGIVTYTASKIQLNPGKYTVTAVVFNDDTTKEYDHIEKAATFEVVSEDHQLHGKVNLFGEWRQEKI